MGTTDSKSPLPNPSELQKVRFDYAWKWFNFHADQRTKMFNFMLIGLGIFASAVVSAIEKKLLLEAAVLSMAGVVVAVAFRLLDKRNRYLYLVAMDVLIDAEKNVVFGEEVEFDDHKKNPKKFGIARRIALEEEKEPPGWDGKLKGIEEGRHRYLMPLLSWGFAGLFAIAAAYSWFLWWKSLNSTQPPVAQVVCCQAGTSSDAASGQPGIPSGGPTTTTIPPTTDLVAVNGTGTISGLHWSLVVFGLVLAAGGAAAFFKGHKVVGSLAVAAGLATSVLPNLSVPLTARFHFDPKIEAKLADRIDLRIDRLLDIIRRSEPAMLASGRFGGFGDGVELFDCKDAANQETVADINAGIARTRERQLQAVVLLVGGTDRRPLSQALRRRFESNAGLARARVNEVERCLDLSPAQGAGPALRPPEVIRLITGPSYTPGSQEAADVMSKKMAEDREVRAFVIGVPLRG
jgi:hypothetical protein